MAGPTPVDPYQDDLGRDTPTANTEPAPPYPPPAAPTPPATGPTAPPPVPSTIATTVTRAELDAALLDFSALVQTVSGRFTPTGVKLDKVAANSLFAKAGLRAGDVVLSVDGKPMRTLDDAADLYARGETLRAATVQIQRAGKPVTLKLVIR